MGSDNLIHGPLHTSMETNKNAHRKLFSSRRCSLSNMCFSRSISVTTLRLIAKTSPFIDVWFFRGSTFHRLFIRAGKISIDISPIELSWFTIPKFGLEICVLLKHIAYSSPKYNRTPQMKPGWSVLWLVKHPMEIYFEIDFDPKRRTRSTSWQSLPRFGMGNRKGVQPQNSHSPWWYDRIMIVSTFQIMFSTCVLHVSCLHVRTTDPKWRSKHFHLLWSQLFGAGLRDSSSTWRIVVWMFPRTAQRICPGRWAGKVAKSLCRNDVEPGLIVFCIGWLKDFRSAFEFTVCQNGMIQIDSS